MLDILQRLRDYLSGIVDPQRQASVERQTAPAGQPADRLPLVQASQ